MKTPPDPCLVFRARPNRDGSLALIPILEEENRLGPMFGGNLASALYGHDSLKVYRIHDRYETPEEYDALSQ